jgi:hypothetical protein
MNNLYSIIERSWNFSEVSCKTKPAAIITCGDQMPVDRPDDASGGHDQRFSWENVMNKFGNCFQN